MKKLIYFLTCVLYLVFAACVTDPQDIPPQITADPEFSVGISIGGSELNLSAGESGYIMKATSGIDSQGVVVYNSTFRPVDCDIECGPTLSWEFMDNAVVGSPNAGVEKTFVAGEKQFLQPAEITPDSVEVQFVLPEGQPDSNIVFWQDGNGNFSINTEWQGFYGIGDQLDLCVRSINPLGECFTSQCMSFEPFDHQKGCLGSLEVEEVNSDYFKVKALSDGFPPFNYTWFSGETTSSIVLPFTGEGKYLVEVAIEDARGCTTYIQQEITASPVGLSTCELPVELVIIPKSTVTTDHFSTVNIIYTDESGDVYSTFHGLQSASTFDILSVADHGLNPDGFPTKKITFDMDCILHHASMDQSIQVSISGGEIAISYSE